MVSTGRTLAEGESAGPPGASGPTATSAAASAATSGGRRIVADGTAIDVIERLFERVLGVVDVHAIGVVPPIDEVDGDGALGLLNTGGETVYVVELGDRLLDLDHDGVGGLERGALFERHVDGESAFLAQRLLLQHEKKRHDQRRQQRHADGDGDAHTVPQAGLQQHRVHVQQPPGSQGLERCTRESARAEHRYECECDEQRRHERKGDGEGELADDVLKIALDKHDRQEDGNRRGGGGDDGAAHLRRADAGRFHGVLAGLEVFEDRLHDDDAVVRQHAHRQRQPTQGEHVQRQVPGVHEVERQQQRSRNGEQQDADESDAAEKQEEHTEPQEHADDGRLLQCAESILHERRLIVGDE